MFEGSLIESLSIQPRHPWTKAVSFAIQGLLIAIALLASLLYTEALPNHAFSFWIESPPPATAPPSPSTAVASHKPIQSELNNGQLLLPTTIPSTVAVIHDDTEASTANSAAIEGVPGAVPGSTGDHTLTNLMQSVHAAVPRSVTPRSLRISSGIAQGFLIHQIRPQYPSLARSARIEGMVVLQAVIGKDGTIQNLHLVSGHPLLVQAAMDSVRQWRYRPYELNHEPVEVETTIQVNFTLGGEN